MKTDKKTFVRGAVASLIVVILAATSFYAPFGTMNIIKESGIINLTQNNGQ